MVARDPEADVGYRVRIGSAITHDRGKLRVKPDTLEIGTVTSDVGRSGAHSYEGFPGQTLQFLPRGAEELVEGMHRGL
jgi:hypothetical protein